MTFVTLFFFFEGFPKHLEKKHGVIFGLRDIMKAGESNNVPDHENEEAQLNLARTRTDADTVKELVEMKFLPKKRKMRLKTRTNRFFSRKYQVLTEEVL